MFWMLIFIHSVMSILRKILKKNKIQIAHAQQPIDALLAWMACLGTSIKIALTLHGYDHSPDVFAAFLTRFIIKRTRLGVHLIGCSSTSMDAPQQIRSVGSTDYGWDDFKTFTCMQAGYSWRWWSFFGRGFSWFYADGDHKFLFIEPHPVYHSMI